MCSAKVLVVARGKGAFCSAHQQKCEERVRKKVRQRRVRHNLRVRVLARLHPCNAANIYICSSTPLALTQLYIKLSPMQK